MISAIKLFTVPVCSLGCLSIAYYQIKEWLVWRSLEKDGLETSAVITDIYPKLKRPGKSTFVSYRYEDSDNKSHTGKQWVITSNYNALAPGLYIPVRYLRSKPAISAVENDSGLWGRTCAGLFCFTLLAFIIVRTLGY